MILDWASAGTPIDGEQTSGDRGVVVPYPGGALVAVIDGLGHGKEAAEAATLAQQTLLAAPYEPVAELVQRCHVELRRTRGAVMSVAQFDAAHHTMSWVGVGNVEALLVRAQGAGTEAIAARGGTVGYMLPPLHPRTLDVAHGDTLVLASDGIKHGFRGEILAARQPQEIVDEIMRLWSIRTDDAFVMAARYTGATEEQPA